MILTITVLHDAAIHTDVQANSNLILSWTKNRLSSSVTLILKRSQIATDKKAYIFLNIHTHVKQHKIIVSKRRIQTPDRLHCVWCRRLKWAGFLCHKVQSSYSIFKDGISYVYCLTAKRDVVADYKRIDYISFNKWTAQPATSPAIHHTYSRKDVQSQSRPIPIHRPWRDEEHDRDLEREKGSGVAQ